MGLRMRPGPAKSAVYGLIFRRNVSADRRKGGTSDLNQQKHEGRPLLT